MNRCFRTLVALALSVGTMALAQGEDQVGVDIHYDNATVDQLLYDSGENISLTNITNAVDHINIWCPTNTWHIGRVSLSGTADTAIRVIIGAASWNGGDPLFTPAATNWAGLSAGGTLRYNLHLEGRIKGNLTNSVLVGHLYRFDVDDAVNAGIKSRSDGVAPAGFFAVECGSLSSSGNMLCMHGDMRRVQTDGDLAGEVHAMEGTITDVIVGGHLTGKVHTTGTDETISIVTVAGNLTGQVRANAGVLGDIIVEGVIDAPFPPDGLSAIRSKDGVNRIVAQSISDETSIGLVADAGLGRLGLLKTTNGDFAGQLTCRSLVEPTGGGEAGIIIWGDCAGTINIQSGGSLDRDISIDGSLSGTINYAADGLTHQVIVNALDDGGGWTGDVVIGTGGSQITLSTPYYSALSSQLGGGAVGLAHFNLHGTDCYPPNFGSLVLSSTTTVYLRHYGPVFWDAQTNPDPVRIYWRETGRHPGRNSPRRTSPSRPAPIPATSPSRP